MQHKYEPNYFTISPKQAKLDKLLGNTLIPLMGWHFHKRRLHRRRRETASPPRLPLPAGLPVPVEDFGQRAIEKLLETESPGPFSWVHLN